MYKYENAEHLIEKVRKEGETQQRRIHNIALCFLAEWARNPNEGTRVAELLTALQNASKFHSKSFGDWMAVKSGMQWSKEKECWYVHANQKFTKTKLDAAKKEPFWEVSPPQKAKPITDEQVLKMLEGILKRQEKHDKEPVEGDDYTKVANEHIRAGIQNLREVILHKEATAKAKA